MNKLYENIPDGKILFAGIFCASGGFRKMPEIHFSPGAQLFLGGGMDEKKVLRKYLRPIMRLKRDCARNRGAGWNWGVIICGIFLVIFWWCLLSRLAHAEVYDADVIVNAIYQAEGGEKTRHPYGILSVRCDGQEECRKVCYNTVVNNFTRWQSAGAQGDFLEFLANRYCPVGASNDPQGLNRNWISNVRYFIAKEEK